MTRIFYDPVQYHLRIEGHAGEAAKGEDIVCAGISALAFALLKAATEDWRPEIEQDEKKGIIDIKCRPKSVWDIYHCAFSMETIAGGLELIAEEYPQHAAFERSLNNDGEEDI